MNREEYNNRMNKLMDEGHSVYTAEAILTGDPMLSALALAAGSGKLEDMQRFVSISKLYRNTEKLNELESSNTEVYNDEEHTL